MAFWNGIFRVVNFLAKWLLKLPTLLGKNITDAFLTAIGFMRDSSRNPFYTPFSISIKKAL